MPDWIKFTDEIKFDTSGPLRIEERSDGVYVVGCGMLIPVKSIEEAKEVIRNSGHPRAVQ